MTFRFGAITTLSLTAIVLVACGGKTISIGSEDSAETVVPSAVNVATSECSQGYEHANICCTGGGNGNEPTCKSYPNDPFHPCDSGWTTYPNAATCCSLDNPADCTGSCGNDSVGNSGECELPPSSVSASEDGGFEVDAGVTTTCESRCPPGYSGISPYDDNGCCRTDNGVSSCFGEAVAYADASVPEDASSVPPILLPDGGVYDAGTATVDAGEDVPQPPSGGSITACSFDCPDGWFVADAIEGLCCNNTSSGAEECFAAVFPDDNGGGSVSGGESTPPSNGPSFTDASVTPSP
jgi:hypothetical protein